VAVACPCCGFLTIPKLASDEICQVYYWHDDGQNDANTDEVLGGPAAVTWVREFYLRQIFAFAT